MNPSKVLYISYDGMTDPLGQSQVIPYLQHLSSKGHKITILSFEKKHRFQGQQAQIRAILDKSGIKWEPQLFSVRPPLLSKMYDLMKMKRVAGKLHRQHKFDFVHCRSYIPADTGLHLWHKYKVPFLFDMRGFWVDERVDNGQWNLKKPFFNFLYKRYKQKEKAYFDESHHIVSLTWKGKEELVKNYQVNAEKVTVIPCCVDMDLFDYRSTNPEAIAALKQKLNIQPGEKVISYLGSLGGWYLQKEMLDFFAVLKQRFPASKFLFITHDATSKVLDAAKQSGVAETDVIVQPAARKEVPLYLALSNWSIFFIKDAYSKKASSPTKQGEIMAMGVPIICNDIGDTGRVVEAAGAGALVKGFNAEEYNSIVKNLDVANEEDRRRNRAAAAEYYDLQNGASSYQHIYQQIFGVNSENKIKTL